MASYELNFVNGQLGDFNSSGFTNGYFGEQQLTINNNHPGDRLVAAGAIGNINEITGWRLTVQGDEGHLDAADTTGNDVIPNAAIIVEYSTDGGTTWNSYTAGIGYPSATYYARQDEEGWMALTADTDDADGQFGFIVADAGVTPGQNFVTDETVIETQTGEYALPCFTGSTLISTENGVIRADRINIGDRLLTLDDGLQAVRWKSSVSLSAAELSANPHLRPIRIKAGALGKHTPTTDLLVSPQHRVLIRSHIALRMFDTDEILVAAKQLLGVDGVEIAEDVGEVTYVHFLFDAHQILFSNGAWSESLYTGPEALKSVGPGARQEIYELFPDLCNGAPWPSARPILNGRLIRELASRHVKNGKPLIK